MIRFHEVTFFYPGAVRPALRKVNLEIAAGTLCLVAGASGSGKSTLLRCINGLVPHFTGGRLEGSIQVAGLDPVRLSPQKMSRQVGFVFQDPETQFVVDVVEDEVAFALENAAVPPVEMRTRVDEALTLLELIPLRNRRLETLSGGERQRVAIAAALALRPKVLVLDEPTSQLDPYAAEEVLQALVRLNRDLGLTVIVAEHRLERVLPFAGQLVYLDADRPGTCAGSPGAVLSQIQLAPPVVALGKALGWQPLPLTVKEAQAQLKKQPIYLPQRSNAYRQPCCSPFIRVEKLEVFYGDFPALRGVSLALYPGEIAVLVGSNGAGKSTLLRALVGLLRAQKGRILLNDQDIAAMDTAGICRQVGYLPQDPNALLFAETVLEELRTTLRNHGLLLNGGEENKSADWSPHNLLDALGLQGKALSYPRDLSAGERQRVALGAVTIPRPQGLLLDEPTRGLDYAAKMGLLKLLEKWREAGMAILLVTHDVELAAAAADRVILLEQGQVEADGSPAEVLSRLPHFTPQIAQLFPGSGWLTVKDVLHHLRESQSRS